MRDFLRLPSILFLLLFCGCATTKPLFPDGLEVTEMIGKESHTFVHVVNSSGRDHKVETFELVVALGQAQYLDSTKNFWELQTDLPGDPVPIRLPYTIIKARTSVDIDIRGYLKKPTLGLVNAHLMTARSVPIPSEVYVAGTGILIVNPNLIFISGRYINPEGR